VSPNSGIEKSDGKEAYQGKKMALQGPIDHPGNNIIPACNSESSEPEPKHVVPVVPVEDGIRNAYESPRRRPPHNISDEINDRKPDKSACVIPGRNIGLFAV